MKMHCPYCGFRFKTLAANASHIPSLAPIVCESCAEVGLLDNGLPRKLAPGELEELKQSPAWRDFIEPALEVIKQAKEKRS